MRFIMVFYLFLLIKFKYSAFRKLIALQLLESVLWKASGYLWKCPASISSEAEIISSLENVCYNIHPFVSG